MMARVPYAYLIVTLVGAATVALAYRPIRREPFTVVSFAGAWIAGELAFQNIVWQVVVTVVFIEFGALDGWAGWLGLAVAVLNWVGLFGLGVTGLRASDVTAAALDDVRAETFPVPAVPRRRNPARMRVRCEAMLSRVVSAITLDTLLSAAMATRAMSASAA